MRQEFNPLWFIPTSAYLSKYFTTLQDYYPSNGELATIYVKSSNLSQHLHDLDNLITTLNNQTDIIHQVDDWFGGFKEFVTTKQLFGTALVVLSLGDNLVIIFLFQYRVPFQI